MAQMMSEGIGILPVPLFFVGTNRVIVRNECEYICITEGRD
jgi:hypothetical protein